MKKITLTILIVKILTFSSIAQLTFDWVEKFDHAFDDHAQSVTIDRNNNLYFAGYSGGYNQGTDGIFIAKRDSTIQLTVYSPEDISFSYAEAYKIRTDTLGNIYLLFELNGTIGFGNDTITSSPGLHLIKLTDFVMEWHVELPIDNWYESEYLLETDLDGNCYIMENFINTIILGSDTITSAGNTDILITKVSNNGQFLWTRTFGSSSSSRGDVSRGLSLDSAGNIYGIYVQSYYTPNGDGYSHIVKLDSTGELIDQVQITGFDGSGIEIRRFITSASGISYILLYINEQSAIIKDTSLNLNYGGYVLVAYDDSMNFLAKTIVLDTNQVYDFQPRAIQVNRKAQVFIGGKSYSKFNFGTDSISAGFFVLSFDSLMNLNYVKDFATDQWSSTYNRLKDMVIDNDDCINFICNAKGTSVSFDSITFSTNWIDVFFGRLKMEYDTTNNVQNDIAFNPSIKIFPNPFDNIINIDIDIGNVDYGNSHVVLTLRNLEGKIIAQNRSSRTRQISFDSSGYAPGIYLLSLKFQNSLFTYKVIKK